MVKKGEPEGGHRPRAYGTFVPMDGKIELNELDIAILRLLPAEGSKVGKYLPNAFTARQAQRALEDPSLSTHIVAGRLRWLRAGGYAVALKMVGKGGGNKGWQRTPSGAKLLLELEGNGPSET